MYTYMYMCMYETFRVLYLGAGKTYTMLGTTHDPGIMVLTLNDLFKQMKSKEEDVIYKVTMSYMEVQCIYCTCTCINSIEVNFSS